MDCEILFAKTSWKINKFFSSFSALFSDFSWTWKSISQQNLPVKALLWNFVFGFVVWLNLHGGGGGRGAGGRHWWSWVLIMMLCKLSDSFYKNPHHLEGDFILMIILWWFVYTYKIGAKTNFNLMLKMFSIQKISFNLEYKFISMTL